MNTNNEKELLYLQIFGSLVFIITISVSIILTLNNINNMNHKKPFFSQKQENNISLTNRLVITTIALIFTYISYQFYEKNKYSKNIDISRKELIASVFALISTLILLNTTIENIRRKSSNTDINIPII